MHVISHTSWFAVLRLLAGIFLFLWLLCSLVKANQFVRKLAMQPRPGGSSSGSSNSGSSSSAGEMVAGVLYIATNAALVGWLTSGQRLYRRLLLQPPEAPISVRPAVVGVHWLVTAAAVEVVLCSAAGCVCGR